MPRLLATACLLLMSFPVMADWPAFRGAASDGHAGVNGLPLTWSETENVTWKQVIPGLAWSSPVVVGDSIYLTNAVVVQPEATKPAAGNDEAQAEEKMSGEVVLRAMCLDAKTGQTKWDYELFRHPDTVEMHKKNSHASPTPIIENGFMYVHFGSNGTACLTLDGNVVWKNKLEYSPQHGTGGSPAIAGDVLVICCDGSDVQYVVGMDKATGEVKWKTDRETTPSKGFSFATPLVLTIGGQMQAICPGSDAVFAYDPANGKEIWRVNYPDGYSVTPCPVYGAGLVYVCTGFNKPKLLAIDPTGRGDVTETHLKWEFDKAVPHSPSVLYLDGHVYFVSDKGIASCVDARTGEQLWQERLGGNFSASPLYAEGHIYFQDENGKTTVVAAGPEFKVLGTSELNPDARTFASYAITDHAILLRSEQALYRIEK